MGIEISNPVTAVVSAGMAIIDRLFPDPAQKQAAQIELLKMQQTGDLTELATRAGIVQAEASSQNWLTSSWRPIVMLTFTVLIVARWFGWSAKDIQPDEYTKLWDIVQLGLGGYVIGRSGEKIASTIADALKK